MLKPNNISCAFNTFLKYVLSERRQDAAMRKIQFSMIPIYLTVP